MRKKVKGKCRICGEIGELTFEHVPPHAAFNNKSVKILEGMDAISKALVSDKSGRIQQKGMGAYTLCGKCNNNTGAWYGNSFVNWCIQGMEILKRSEGKPSLIYIHYLYPLRIIKQIIAMFFSVNGEDFKDKNQELVKFILNKEKKYLDKKYRIFCYFNCEGGSRSTGIMSSIQTDQSFSLTFKKPIIMSEFSFPPFGYLMTFNSEPPDDRLFEITHFANYGYDEFKIMSLNLKVLPTYLAYAGDYRKYSEIMK